MTVYAITDTKKGEQGLRLLIFKLPLALTLILTLTLILNLAFHQSVTGDRNHFGKFGSCVTVFTTPPRIMIITTNFNKFETINNQTMSAKRHLPKATT